MQTSDFNLETCFGRALYDCVRGGDSAVNNIEASPTVTEPRGLWPAIRESLAGSHRDDTEGAIGQAILRLAIPMVLDLVLESVFAVVDVFFVSRLGADAVATSV